MGFGTQIARFGNDASGLEKMMRLFQAVCMLAVELLEGSNAVPWSRARAQFALGRRYLRFFKFIPTLSAASSSVFSSLNSFVILLETGKMGFLGLYLMLESSTILDAMAVHPTTWAAQITIEANRLWFYSLVCSLLLCIYSFTRLPSIPPPSLAVESPEKSATSEKETQLRRQEAARKLLQQRRLLARDAVMYAADLFIPGAVTGWLRTEPAVVGAAMVVSTLLGSEDIWMRVNG